jgi:GntR family transcriptional regulator/MocR family aminotransferase
MRLPSSRTLAADLGISRNTASLAIDQLLADGWVEARSRSGTYVSAPLSPRAQPPDDRGASRSSNAPPVPFELRPGAVDTFPFERWARIQSRVWSRSVPDLLYDADPAGDAGLRQAIADLVLPARGLAASADDVIIVTSTQSALDLIAATAPAGSAVVVENPGYVFADLAFAGRQLRVVPAPVDDEGLDVDSARRLAPAPSLILVTPATHFPTGVSMTKSRRVKLLEWARETGALIVEEEYDSEPRFDGISAPAPLRTEDPERVITIASLNRLLFRSLRLGFMVAPQKVRDRVLKARLATDGYVGLPQQLVLREFIEEGGYSAHVRRLRELSRERRDALVRLVDPYLGRIFKPKLNSSGLHLVLPTIRHEVADIVAALEQNGIACDRLAGFARGDCREEALLLGFAAFSPDVTQSMQPALAKALDRFA